MTTPDFVKALSQKGYYQYEVKQFIKDFFETLKECAEEDEFGEVLIAPYGKFSIASLRPQRRTHPVTKETVFTKERRKMIYHQGFYFKNELNRSTLPTKKTPEAESKE